MATRMKAPVPKKQCANFKFCEKTLSSRSKHLKCINCRNADKRYKERGMDWCLDQMATTRLREVRLTPYCGKKIAEIPVVRPKKVA